ncbi:MAG: 50S ribosomal protein L25 [Candidatus Latescibacterota bacterium]
MPVVPLKLQPREQVALSLQSRPERGKGPVGRVRRTQGLLPGILYGHKQEPFAFKTEARALERIFSHYGQNALFLLSFEDGGRTPEQAIVRDVQYHKVRGAITHLDLLRIDPSEKVRISVPLHTTGIPVGVRLNSGALQHSITHLDMECVVSEMPAAIEIDITDLDVGDNLHVADLLSQEPRIVTDAEIAIVSVLAPRLVVEPTVAEAEGEAAEGEAAEAAAGGEEQGKAQE